MVSRTVEWQPANSRRISGRRLSPSLRKTAILRTERGDDRKCICCSHSFLLEICGSVLAITRTASCACSAGASTSKPAQLAARSHTLNTRIIRRARALTDFQAKKKDSSQSIRITKLIFLMLHFVTPSTKGTRFSRQSKCLRDVSFKPLISAHNKKI